MGQVCFFVAIVFLNTLLLFLKVYKNSESVSYTDLIILSPSMNTKVAILFVFDITIARNVTYIH